VTFSKHDGNDKHVLNFNRRAKGRKILSLV